MARSDTAKRYAVRPRSRRAASVLIWPCVRSKAAPVQEAHGTLPTTAKGCKTIMADFARPTWMLAELSPYEVARLASVAISTQDPHHVERASDAIYWLLRSCDTAALDGRLRASGAMGDVPHESTQGELFQTPDVEVTA